MIKWKCSVCGYIHEGDESPDQCPVCGADKNLFEKSNGAAVPPAEKTKDATPPQQSPSAKKWRCTVCGYIHEGPEPPDPCPVCGADKSFFEEVVEDGDADPQTIIPAGDQEQVSAAPSPQGPPALDLGPTPATIFGRGFQFIIQQMLKHHAHPITVHIPNGVLPIAFIFIILAVITGSENLQTAAYFNMIFVVLTLPVVIITGYIEWKIRYKGFMTPRFATKIAAAGIVTVSAVIVVAWWYSDPNILLNPSPLKWVFIGLNLVGFGAAATAGLIGGKLVFKD